MTTYRNKHYIYSNKCHIEECTAVTVRCFAPTLTVHQLEEMQSLDCIYLFGDDLRHTLP